VFGVLIVLLLFLDILTKNVCEIKVKNTGFAWGFGSKMGIILVILTLFFSVLACIAWWFYAKKDIFGSVAFAFFIAGALGNIFDRITLGYVRDFITLPFWETFPVFNFADMCLTIGTILLFVFYILRSKKNA